MLLDTDVLIVDQIKNFFNNDFAIRDWQGGVVGHIRTVGGVGKRMFLGNREFIVFDGDVPSFSVNDVVNIGRDRFEVNTPDGRILANIVKEITLFKRRLTVTLYDGSQLSLRGNWIDFHYEVDGVGPNGQVVCVAQVNRSWPGIGAALLGHDRYVVAFAPGTAPVLRQAVLGAVIAIDCIRSKDDNAQASTS